MNKFPLTDRDTAILTDCYRHTVMSFAQVHKRHFPSNAKATVHKGEERAIKSIKKMHREGLSNGAIARVLTEMRIPTKRQGKSWHREMVRQILIREGKLD